MNNTFTLLIGSVVYCRRLYQEFYNTIKKNKVIAAPNVFKQGHLTKADINSMHN